MSTSIQTDLLQHVVLLRNNVAALKSNKCHLYHEKVRYDSETGAPIPYILPDDGYIRIGFCPAEVRRQQLGCGHTMSRYLLRDALDTLKDFFPDSMLYHELQLDLEAIGGDIYKLDIAKGRAERNKTDLLVELKLDRNDGDAGGGRASVIAGVEQEIAEIEAGHDLCVDRIASLQRAILGYLDAAIAAVQRGELPGRGERGVDELHEG